MVSTGSDAKEWIKRKVLMKINDNPISALFHGENRRNHGNWRNYKIKINKKVMKSYQKYKNSINILSFILPFQARALVHDQIMNNIYKKTFLNK